MISGPYYLTQRPTSKLPGSDTLWVAFPGTLGTRELSSGVITVQLSPAYPNAQVRSCTSHEGLHLTVWAGTPLKSDRLWHEYYYLGYDVEPSCTDRDVRDGAMPKMNPKSIRSHLKPYSISSKRRTTVPHAFASALGPCDEYDQWRIEQALTALGQEDLDHLTCVYCGRPGQTWDHLENLVKAGRFNAYGHQIGNLVPSCRECNSEKGGQSFRAFVAADTRLTEVERAALIRRLENHLALAKPIEPGALDPDRQEILSKFLAVQVQILQLMEEADKYASLLRARSDG